MECPIGGPRCSEGYAKGNPALNCSPKSYTTERPSPRSGRGRVRRCGGLTPAAVAPPRGRVRRAGHRDELRGPLVERRGGFVCKNQDDSEVEESLGHELLPLAAGHHSSIAAVSPTPAVRARSASTAAR